ncbi:MAG: hypothetical protein ACLSX2_04830 [Christensenellaceae bacterium]
MMQENEYKKAYRFLQGEIEEIISMLRAVQNQAEQIIQGQTPPKKYEYRID